LFSKFGFSQLALVERPAPEAAVSCVTLHMPDGTFSQIEIQRRQGTQQTRPQRLFSFYQFCVREKYDSTFFPRVKFLNL
jgi:hypothetical protein